MPAPLRSTPSPCPCHEDVIADQAHSVEVLRPMVTAAAVQQKNSQEVQQCSAAWSGVGWGLAGAGPGIERCSCGHICRSRSARVAADAYLWRKRCDTWRSRLPTTRTVWSGSRPARGWRQKVLSSLSDPPPDLRCPAAAPCSCCCRQYRSSSASVLSTYRQRSGRAGNQ